MNVIFGSVKKLTPFFVLLLLLVAGCDSTVPAPQTEIQRSAILGSWSKTVLLSNIEMVLGQDGEYKIMIEGLNDVTGTWRFDDRDYFSVDAFGCRDEGYYEYDFEVGTLLLSTVTDDCRRSLFLDGEWTR